jgi:pyrroline-5-carboxylate reductase
MDKKLPERFSFIGAGAIAEAWIERLLRLGAAAPGQIMASDIRSQRLEELRTKYAVNVTPENREGARFADTVILATPPPDTCRL